jgi:hypothetical protein
VASVDETGAPTGKADANNPTRRRGWLWVPGSPGELPPEAPTDPDMTLSRHPAPVIQP